MTTGQPPTYKELFDKVVDLSNEIHKKTLETDQYMLIGNQPPLKFKQQDKEYTAVKYWFDNDDFVFITDENETYKIDGLLKEM